MMLDIIEANRKIQEGKDSLQRLFDEEVKIISKLDSELNTLTHIIELGNLNGAESMKVIKVMKRLLIARRDAKERHTVMKNILQHNKTIENELSQSLNRISRYVNETSAAKEKFFGGENVA